MSIKNPIITFAALLAFILSGCEKMNSEANAVKDALTIKPAVQTKLDNGVIIQDGTIVYSIGSAFAGGTVAEPEGSSHRCHFYREKFAEGPSWDKVSAMVSIWGRRLTGIEYTQPGQDIDQINISGIDESLGLGANLFIPLEQGQYKGGNPLVSEVRILSYQLSSRNQGQGNVSNNAKIHILITTKAGDVITLLYENTIAFDGYY